MSFNIENNYLFNAEFEANLRKKVELKEPETRFISLSREKTNENEAKPDEGLNNKNSDKTLKSEAEDEYEDEDKLETIFLNFKKGHKPIEVSKEKVRHNSYTLIAFYK